MKSIKIDLETPQIDLDPKSREILEFLEEIEQIYKKD